MLLWACQCDVRSVFGALFAWKSSSGSSENFEPFAETGVNEPVLPAVAIC
jgi:hypothetical protein